MPPFLSPAVPVLRDLQTLPVGHPQSAAELGLLPTSPSPTPLTSDDEDEGGISSAYLRSPFAGNPIGTGTSSNVERDFNSFSHRSHRPGDSIDDPIVLDATTTVPSHTTNVIDTVSNSRQQKECGTRGRSLEEHYECKICFCEVVDLVLGCGHVYCYDYFNKFFHDSVLSKALGNPLLAVQYLRKRRCEPCCPFCKKTLPGCFTRPDNRERLVGFYVPMRCPDSEFSHCFVDDYLVQGTKLRML
ncbi:hypothetical protein BDQ94DRAFT_179254 [Aspergillus welwitschiae]|uniref:RING-type domain-containing protein n=1 Tax=Aspergillus welwitschiae TaxID=1341132 RepID=A0A3F3PGZ7_9EURO|nr:hypothetical protein BDQ94DRAFT_179254 [Aspergillus welwitschiae]RDH26205.1 hypothetical protein BDQ94DRAFT_179254 [Aspergillus welwitschiae]